MTAMPAAQPRTAREFLELSRRHGGFTSWLVEGEVVVNQPKAPHQRAVVVLIQALANWIGADSGRGHVFTPLDAFVDNLNVYGPDVCWFREDRDPGAEGATPYALPDIAAEVRSPSTWRYDIGPKKSGYERAGLPELWLVDTAAHEVLVFRRSKPLAAAFDVHEQLAVGDVLESPLLPDFGLPLERLFV